LSSFSAFGSPTANVGVDAVAEKAMAMAKNINVVIFMCTSHSAMQTAIQQSTCRPSNEDQLNEYLNNTGYLPSIN
jgi:hypothetical protein